MSIPTPGDPTGSSGAPTGTVFNTDGGKNGGFVVTNGTQSGSAIFLFATEDGTVVGWNPGVNPAGSDPTKAGTFGTIAVDNSGNNFTNPDPNQQTGAVYKGLTIATGPDGPIFASDPNSGTVLYASNFRSGQVEVYDTKFQHVALPAGAFSDPNLPKGYAPFNVQVIDGKVYVTYAKQDATKHDDVAGPGNGFVDVFNLDGTPRLANGAVRLISRGPLDSPWGLAIAPAGLRRPQRPERQPRPAGRQLRRRPHQRLRRLHGQVPWRVERPRRRADPDRRAVGAEGRQRRRRRRREHGLLHRRAVPRDARPVRLADDGRPGSAEGPAETQLIQADLDVVQLDLKVVLNDLGGGAAGHAPAGRPGPRRRTGAADPR